MRFLLDHNVAPAFGRALRSLSPEHDVELARDLGGDPNDAEIMLAAAQQSRVIVTHDRGFDCLDEAWRAWHPATLHPGVIQLTRYGGLDEVIARRIDMQLRIGWNPRGALWSYDVRDGWRRMRARRRWSALDPDTPLNLTP